MLIYNLITLFNPLNKRIVQKMSNIDSKIINYSERIKLERIDLASSIPLNGPLTVHIEPTNICNFKCKFCPESFDNYESKAGGLFRLNEEDYDIIIKQLKTLPKLKQLNFFMMGEPLVNKNLTQFIKTAKENDISEWYMVSSNGSLLTREKYKSICESGLDFLRISVFGSNQEIHAETTQSQIKLSRVKENLESFQKFKKENKYLKPVTMAKMIDVGRDNEKREFLDLFDGVGDETIVEPLTNWNDPEEGNLSKSGEKNVLKTDHYSNRKKVCPYPFYSLVIHSDLKVSICCVDWEKKTLVGDLRKDTLINIWNGKEIREIQIKHLEGKKSQVNGCASCTYHHTAKDNIDGVDVNEFLKKI